MNGIPIQTSVSGLSPLTINGAKKRLVILTSGTQYVVPVGVYALEVEVIGLGSGGSAGNNLGGPSGQGGNAGGWALGLYPSVQPGQVFTVQINNTQTWFGSQAELFANSAGNGRNFGGSNVTFGVNGQLGAYGGSTLNVSGLVVVKLGANGGRGGSNVRGFGGRGGSGDAADGSQNASAGEGYGSGGGGGGTGIFASGVGGAGGPAAIFVWEYYL